MITMTTLCTSATLYTLRMIILVSINLVPFYMITMTTLYTSAALYTLGMIILVSINLVSFYISCVGGEERENYFENRDKYEMS